MAALRFSHRALRVWLAAGVLAGVPALVQAQPGAPPFPHGDLQRVSDFEAACSTSGLIAGSDEKCSQAISMALGKMPIIEETRLPDGKINHVSKLLPPDAGKAGWLGEEACDHAHGQSCMLYVMLLERGDTVPQDIVQAQALTQFACHHNHVRACESLKSAGIEILMQPLRPRRVDWAKKPAPAPLSADIPAEMLKKLQPPPASDPVIALMQQQARARLKNVPMDQPIYPEDEMEASMVRRCLAGASGQCDSLGRAYASGTGLPLDAARAKYYSEKACQGGQPAACARVGLTMPQVARDALSRRRTSSLLVVGAIAALILASICGIAIVLYRRMSGAGSGSVAREPAPRPVAVAPLPGAVRPSPRRP
jgi:TPR repeat protein